MAKKAAPARKKRAASPAAGAASVQSLVKELVDQFDQPLTFYRELIQNSIDAGSNRIDVTLEYADGAALIRVRDDGEGMDERIIDDYLLVLFSSSKEGDFTKIGKFGIGFVSVFAPRPDLVRVTTGKAGQSWRLDFPSYRKYEKYRLSEPRDGTLVELTKKMPREDFDRLAKDSRETLRYWCKHSESRIYFQVLGAGPEPALITEELDLEGGCSLRHTEEGTEILLGFTSDPEPPYGFYNRGLTLKEGRRAFFPGVTLKVKSRYLEHTLTRDNVLEDANYSKLMGCIRRLVSDELPGRLKIELEDLAARLSKQGSERPVDRDALVAAWDRRLPFYKTLVSGLFGRWTRGDWDILPTLSGAPVSVAEVTNRLGLGKGRLYFDDAPNPVTAALEAEGQPVLASGPWVQEVCSLTKWEAAQASKTLISPRVVEDPEPLKDFLGTVRMVDSRTGCKYRGILPASFDYPGSCIKDSLFVTQKRPGALSHPSERGAGSLFSVKRFALLNVDHPVTRDLNRLYRDKPGMAAYFCLKIMHLHDGEVAPDRKTEHCNIAEGLERRLLDLATKIDGGFAP